MSGNPAPNTGALANQSALAPGLHQHDFNYATSTMSVGTGDVMYAYVYLDPANPPSEVMLQWNDGTWEHRAYWGANSITWGSAGTPGRVNMGALPPAGSWQKLQVNASGVALEGRSVQGMGFSTYNGRATFDTAGRFSPGFRPPPATITVTATKPTASPVGRTPGVFTFSRSGDTTSALTVNYSLGGTAVPGQDYNPPVATVTLPAGVTNADLAIVPTTSSSLMVTHSVVLTVAPSTNYSAAIPQSALVTILPNSVPGTRLSGLPSGAKMLSWPSVPNAVYRVACKTNLSDMNWTYIGDNITAGSTTMNWTDAGAAGEGQRFYLIIQAQ